MGSLKGGTPTTTTTTNQPPPQVLQAYEWLTGTAQNVAAQNPNPFPYTGQMVAGMTPDQMAALGGIFGAPGIAMPWLEGAAGNFAGAGNLLGAGSNIIGGTLPQAQGLMGMALPQYGQAAQYGAQGTTPYYNVVGNYMSPYIGDVVNATQNQFNNANAIQSQNLLGQAIRAGNAFGGDREGIAQAQLAGQQQLAQAPVIAGLYNQGYQQAMQAAQAQNAQALQAGALANQTGAGLAGLGTAYGGLGLQGAGALGALGSQMAGIGTQMGGLGLGAGNQQLAAMQAGLQGAGLEQQTQQAALNAAYQQWLMGQGFPYQQTSWLSNIIEGLGAGSGGTSTGQTTPGFNPWSSLMGAGLVGSQMYSSGLLGALGTGLMGLFSSDERMKENIQPVGKTFSGDTVYRFNYKGDPRTQIGLIAQDIEDKHPGAVYDHPSGMKMIDYGAATEDAAAKRHFQSGGPLPMFGGSDIFGPIQPWRQGIGMPGREAPRVEDTSAKDMAAAKAFAQAFGKSGKSSWGHNPIGDVGNVSGWASSSDTISGSDATDIAQAQTTGDLLLGDGGGWQDGGGVGGLTPAFVAFQAEQAEEDRANADIARMLGGMKNGGVAAGYALGGGFRQFSGSISGGDDDYTAPGYNVPRRQVVDYIRQAAQERGIDPNTALRVAASEGLNNWQSTVMKGGMREPSYGPFQLYTQGGLGNEFQTATGLDPADPNNWQKGVDFALDRARQGGWAPWYGARRAGITGMQGIDGQGGGPLALAAPEDGVGASEGVGAIARAMAPSGSPRTAAGDLGGEESTDTLAGGQGADTVAGGEGATDDADARRQAIMAAGFAMMAGRSPRFMQNVGEAGMVGMSTYAQARKLSDEAKKTQAQINRQEEMLAREKARDAEIRRHNMAVEGQHGIPEGWRRTVTGGLERIPGGPADPAVLREQAAAQGKLLKEEEWTATSAIAPNGMPILLNKRTGETRIPGMEQGTTPAAAPTQATGAQWIPVAGDEGTRPQPPTPLRTVIDISPNAPEIQGLPVPQTMTQSQRNTVFKENEKIKAEALKNSEASTQAMGRLTEMDDALSSLPEHGFLAPGSWSKERLMAAKAVNSISSMVGIGPWFDPKQVGSLEEAEKTQTIGGFLTSRLVGGGQHAARQIIEAGMKAYPGAENTPLGGRMIIAGAREALQRERDRYEFLIRNEQRFNGNLYAANLVFDKVNPVEKYVTRARLSVVPPDDLATLRQNANNPEAVKLFDKLYGTGLSKYLIEGQP